MKILLLLIVAMSTFGFVVANNYDAKKDNNKETAKSEQINNDSNRNIDIIRVNSQGITLPFTITVPVPAGTVKSVSGPCNANMTNWTVNNGNLSITYTRPVDIGCLEDPDTYFIEYVTYEGHKYTAVIISE